MSRAPIHRHLALVGFMGAGKTTLGRAVAERIGRPFVDLDAVIEREAGLTIPEIFDRHGEAEFRCREAEAAARVLGSRDLGVLALGGGACGSERTRAALADHAVTCLVDVDVETAWARAARSDRPLARDEHRFRALFEERRPVYRGVADAVVRRADDAVLAAGGVQVGIGALDLLGDVVPAGRAAALVSDDHVAGIHGADAQVALSPRLAGFHTLPPGEEAKSLASYARLLEELRLERGGVLVALGGGCTSDAAGFAAATFLRGVDWVAVPTSLVAQVDAAIGGKTAINLEAGKNLVGAFHWPLRTLVDPALLQTLPERERREGLAEVVKTGLLAGQEVWEEPDAELVRRCAVYKTAVCLRDADERGERAVLNLGHTFAHALEAGARYGPVTHGTAVALGLRAALELSVRHLGLDRGALDAVERTLAPRPVRVDAERAWAALCRDKKTAGGRPRLVLLEAPGKPLHGVELPEDEVRAALDSLVAR